MHHTTQSIGLLSRVQKLSQVLLPSNLSLCEAPYQRREFQPDTGPCAFYVNLWIAVYPGVLCPSSFPGVFQPFPVFTRVPLGLEIGVGDLIYPPACCPWGDPDAGSWHAQVVLSSPSSTSQKLSWAAVALCNNLEFQNFMRHVPERKVSLSNVYIHTRRPIHHERKKKQNNPAVSVRLGVLIARAAPRHVTYNLTNTVREEPVWACWF